jgi:hypothetical protein
MRGVCQSFIYEIGLIIMFGYGRTPQATHWSRCSFGQGPDRRHRNALDFCSLLRASDKRDLSHLEPQRARPVRSLPSLESLGLPFCSVVDIQGNLADAFDGTNVDVGPAFDVLWNSGTITCKSSNATFSGLPRPTAAIVDVSTLRVLSMRSYLKTTYSQVIVYDGAKAIRTTAGTQCNIALFFVVSASNIVRIVTPEELGGLGDLRKRIEDRVAVTNGDYVEEGNNVGLVRQDLKRVDLINVSQIYRRAKGEVVETPGLPPIFDYEWFPQEVYSD